MEGLLNRGLKDDDEAAVEGESPPQFAQKGLAWSKRRRPRSSRLETSKQRNLERWGRTGF